MLQEGQDQWLSHTPGSQGNSRLALNLHPFLKPVTLCCIPAQELLLITLFFISVSCASLLPARCTCDSPLTIPALYGDISVYCILTNYLSLLLEEETSFQVKAKLRNLSSIVSDGIDLRESSL